MSVSTVSFRPPPHPLSSLWVRFSCHASNRPFFKRYNKGKKNNDVNKKLTFNWKLHLSCFLIQAFTITASIGLSVDQNK